MTSCLFWLFVATWGEMLMEKAPELECLILISGRISRLDCFVTVMNASVAKLSC